jgi:hypothetical protein
LLDPEGFANVFDKLDSVGNVFHSLGELKGNSNCSIVSAFPSELSIHYRDEVKSAPDFAFLST